MLKSKPIGWITAGTLVCLAGVALACRLRDGKGVSSEANAAPWCDREQPTTATPPVKPPKKQSALVVTQTALAEAAEQKIGPVPIPPRSPGVGETVENAPRSPAASAVVAPDDLVPPPPDTRASGLASGPPSEPPGVGTEMPEKPAEEKIPGPPPPSREPQTNLGMPEPESACSPIRPVKAESKPEAAPPVPNTSQQPSEPKAVGLEKKQLAPLTADKPADVPAPPPVSAGVKEESKIPVPVKPSVSCTPAVSQVTPPAAEPTYKVSEKGETLREIAKRTLGSEERWTEIDKLNPDLRAEAVVPAGKVVRLPVEARVGWNAPSVTPGSAETQGMPPTKATSVRPLPVVRPKRAESTKVKASLPLTGTYTCKLDDKRGLVLPKEVCAQLGKAETMLLTPGPDQCLWLGTQASAARVLERVEKSGAADQEVQTFRRVYYSQSEKATVDGAGKLAIAEKLAEYAGLGKEVVLIGIDDHFELWDAAKWQRYSQHKDSSPKP